MCASSMWQDQFGQWSLAAFVWYYYYTVSHAHVNIAWVFIQLVPVAFEVIATFE